MRSLSAIDVGEFVAVQGKGNQFNQRLELIIDKIRRVIPEDAKLGFREEDCIPCSPRPLDEMWRELEGRIASVQSAPIRELLTRMVARYEAKLRVWPAARSFASRTTIASLMRIGRNVLSRPFRPCPWVMNVNKPSRLLAMSGLSANFPKKAISPMISS
jgi:hypothetical protein